MLKPRNRMVVFRLTQDEYESVRSVWMTRGARNLSDFARSALLLSAERDRQVDLEQKIEHLQAALERMSQLLEQIAVGTGAQETAAHNTAAREVAARNGGTGQ